MIGGPYAAEHCDPLQLLPTPGSVSTMRPVGASAMPTMDTPGQNVVLVSKGRRSQ
jgi:hypothetical protein